MTCDFLHGAQSLTQRTDCVILSTLDGHPDTRLLFNLRKQRAGAFASGPAVLANPFATWLGTNTSSRKVAQIRKDPRVCLYYSDAATFEGVGLQGTVEEVLDPAIRASIWTPEWEGYYPGGCEGGDFTLLRFHPDRGRYYHGLQVFPFDAARA